VNLSSLGAQNADGGGPINGLHDVENRLNQTGAFITHLRPAYFFENFLSQMSSIQESNSIFLPVSGKTRIPMVGTNDIALVASEILSDDTWTGRPVQEIPGPEDLSFDEAADAISRGIGRAVEHVQVEEVAFREALSGAGMSDVGIDAYCELFRGLESGQLNAVEERTEESATPTTLEEFAHRVMKPLLLEQVESEQLPDQSCGERVAP
jgi:uncharacterized protein YbjT (DUF2867 family)